MGLLVGMRHFFRLPSTSSDGRPAAAEAAAITSVDSGRPATAVARITAGLCLRRPRSASACRECARACPVGAVSIGHGPVSIASTCLNCGACAVACPTGAISVPTTSLPVLSGNVLTVECARVPIALIDERAWIVSCAAGIGLTDLALVAEASATLHLVDRGLCAACPASTSGATVRDTYGRLTAAITPIDGSGGSLDYEVAPPLEFSPHPAGTRPAPSRRSVLRALFPSDRPSRAPRGRIAEREALARLAARAGHTLDGRHFPVATANHRCRDNGACVRRCPTGALTRRVSGPQDEIADLLFDASRCIGCGECVSACAVAALDLRPAGSGPRPVRSARLHRTVRRICAACEDPFSTETADADLCPLCTRQRAMLTDLFSSHPRGSSRLPASSTAVIREDQRHDL